MQSVIPELLVRRGSHHILVDSPSEKNSRSPPQKKLKQAKTVTYKCSDSRLFLVIFFLSSDSITVTI